MVNDALIPDAPRNNICPRPHAEMMARSLPAATNEKPRHEVRGFRRKTERVGRSPAWGNQQYRRRGFSGFGRIHAGADVRVVYCQPMVWMMAGPMMTTNNTGRKNTIIGTVSFGGNAAAFFSASDMRMSRFSLAITRSAWLTGVP